MKKYIIIVLLLATGICTYPVYAQNEQHKNGEVAMKTGKMMIMKDGQWVQMKEDVTMKDGTVVKADGTVIEKGSKARKLAEGESVSVEGNHKKDKPKTYKKGEDSLLKGK